MQTDPDAVRYLVSHTGSKMAVRSTDMWIFDHMSDALEFIRENSRKVLEAGYWVKPADVGKVAYLVDNFRLYQVSPTKKPKKIFLSHKMLGVPNGWH